MNLEISDGGNGHEGLWRWTFPWERVTVGRGGKLKRGRSKWETPVSSFAREAMKMSWQ